MFKDYFILLLLAHIIGDFYAQTDIIAQRKQRSVRWVFLHGLLYGASVLLVCLPFASGPVFLFGGFSAIAHMLTDLLKCILTKKKSLTPLARRNIFFIDQAVHLLSIAALAVLFTHRGHTLLPCGIAAQVGALSGIELLPLLPWAAALLATHKPSNTAIALVLALYKPEAGESPDTQGNKRAGRFIGTLERVIMVILISMQQYSAIGLVLTAKSIARYDKITKDADFAEYYLLGTLMSVLAALEIGRAHV